MSGDELDIVTQGPEAFLYGMDQGVVIAFRKIGPSDGSTEQYVADDGETGPGLKKYNMAGGMAGAMMHIQGNVTELHRIPFIQPPVRHERLCPAKPEFPAGGIQGIDPEAVVGMWSFDGDLEPPRELRDAARVIDMPMGHQYLLDSKTGRPGRCRDPIDLASGIDDRRLAGLLTAQQGAILLKWGNGNDLYFHCRGLCSMGHFPVSVERRGTRDRYCAFRILAARL